MFQLVPEGILALIAVLLSWALAVVLFRVSTPGSVARKLSLLLVVEGTTLGSSDAILFLLTSPQAFFDQTPGLEAVTSIIHTVGDCAMLVLYPAFLAVALQAPLTRPFMQRKVLTVLTAYSVALFVVVFLVIIKIVPLGIGDPLLCLSLVVVFAFALVASIQVWRSAQHVRAH